MPGSDKVIVYGVLVFLLGFVLWAATFGIAEHEKNECLYWQGIRNNGSRNYQATHDMLEQCDGYRINIR